MLNILFLVAHADDEALGPGGLIKKLTKNKLNVKLMVLSDGKITVRNKPIDNSKHLEKSAKILGIKNLNLLGYKDQIFEKYPVSEIANSILSHNFNPDIIITHSKSELNKDHRITLEVAKIIARPQKKNVQYYLSIFQTIPLIIINNFVQIFLLIYQKRSKKKF